MLVSLYKHSNCDGSYQTLLPSFTPRFRLLFLPEGKRSMTGWLSTCSVALPPLRVNRTTWYLPSLTITALSSMIMSSVPTLKITPIFPLSYRQRKKDSNVRRLYLHTLQSLGACYNPTKYHDNTVPMLRLQYNSQKSTDI